MNRRKKIRKKILGIILCLCLSWVVIGCGEAGSKEESDAKNDSVSEPKESAQEIPESFVQKGAETAGGKWNGLTWVVTDANELIITGHMADPNRTSQKPWANYKKHITSACLAFSGAESLSQFLSSCASLEEVNLSALDTSKVTNMEAMFAGCSSLTSLDLSSFDTGNVTNMATMFAGCSSLTGLDLSSFDTGNVTDMRYMFNGCSSLTSLDLSSFDTGNVTNMWGMFSECHSLASLNLSSFDTGNVTEMGCMFNRCRSLTSLDLSSFDTSKETIVSGLFADCTSLRRVLVGDGWHWRPKEENRPFYNCPINNVTYK